MTELTAEDRERVRLEAQKICQEALEETARSEAQMNEAAQRREQARLDEMAYRREQDNLAGLRRLYPPASQEPVPLQVKHHTLWKTLRWLLPKVIIMGVVTLFAWVLYRYFDFQETWCTNTCQPGMVLRCESFLLSRDKAKVFCITPEGRVTVGIRK